MTLAGAIRPAWRGAVMAGLAVLAWTGVSTAESPPPVSYGGGAAALLVRIEPRSPTAASGLLPAANGIEAPAPPAPPTVPAPEPVPSATAGGVTHVAYDLFFRLPVRLGPAPASVWLPFVFNEGFALDSQEYWILVPAPEHWRP